MPLNHYVTLGRSGLRVSPLCLGAMTFGEDWGWGSSVKESEAIMDRFFERGGNFIDTANAYTKGHSEVIIGDHVGRHPGKRDRLVIATKFTSNLYRGDPNGGGMSRKAIVAQCEQSLRRLQTSYIDLYWLHAWGRDHPDRRDHAGPGRPGDQRQGPLHRLFRHARVEVRRSADDRPHARLVPAHRAADRIFASPAHGRRRAGAHGAGTGAGHHPLVPAQERRADREIHPRRSTARSRPRAAPGPPMP